MLVLILTQLIFGKKASFPYGILVGFSPWTIGAVVITMDLFEIPFFRWLIGGAFDRIKFLNWLHKKLDHKSSKLAHKKLYKWFIRAGDFGVFAITAIPGAGGVQSGALLSHLLHMPSKKAYFLILSGAVVGCLIFVLGSKGILIIVK